MDGALEGQSETTLSPMAAVARHMAGGQSSGGMTTEEVIAFSGIPDPASEDIHFSHRIQSQRDADDLEMGRAMMAAKLQDIVANTGMSVIPVVPFFTFPNMRF